MTPPRAAGPPHEVRRWLTARSSRADDWPPAALLAAKGDTTVSVVLPARDEEATVGGIVAAIRGALVEEVPVVDELLVVDSHSRDATAEVAAAAGARVVRQDDVLADLPPSCGKGDALWKGLAATTGDVVLFVDADLRDFCPSFVTGLLGPLLSDPAVAFVKGFYHRPLVTDAATVRDGGGRVSELLARPLINAYWPALSGFVQPLAGEYGGRRAVLQRVPFVTGYGVELAMLIDLLELVGLDALAQVDLGHRGHRHHDLEQLSRMAAQILVTATERLQRHGHAVFSGPCGTSLTQFRRASGPSASPVDRELVTTDVSYGERPPLADVLAGLPRAAS